MFSPFRSSSSSSSADKRSKGEKDKTLWRLLNDADDKELRDEARSHRPSVSFGSTGGNPFAALKQPKPASRTPLRDITLEMSSTVKVLEAGTPMPVAVVSPQEERDEASKKAKEGAADKHHYKRGKPVRTYVQMR